MGEGPAPLVDNLGIAGDPIDVVARFLDLPYLLFLDSATGGALAGESQLGRYSFLSADPALVIRSKGRVTELRGPGRPWARLDRDPLLAVRELLAPFTPAPVVGLPPFQGGVAGYVGYDYGAVLERLPAPRYDDLAISDVVLGLYDWVIAWDHRLETGWIISTGMPETGPAQADRARARLAMVQERLRDPARVAPRPPRPPAAAAEPAATGRPEAPTYPVLGVEGAEAIGLRSTFTHRGYLDAVARVREYIVAGDIFQANLSQRLRGADRRFAVRALLSAPPEQPGALRRLSRLRRRSAC